MVTQSKITVMNMKMNADFSEPDEKLRSLPFTNDERKYFHLLSEIPEFRFVVTEIRKACNIHPEGIIKMWPITKEQFQNINHCQLLQFSVMLTEKLHIIPDWTMTISSLLLGIPLIKIQITNEPFRTISNDKEVIITVRQRISRTKLATLIRTDKNLGKQLGALPKRELRVNKKSLSRDLTLLNIKLFIASQPTKKILDIFEGVHAGQNIDEQKADIYIHRLSAYLNSLFEHPDFLTHVVANRSINEWFEKDR